MRNLLLSIVVGLAAVGFGGRLELVTSVPLERARYLEVAGDYAWVARNIEGATLLDVSDPRAPRVARDFAPEEMQPLHFRLLPEENLMVSADRFRGLVIYDISTPDSPTTVSVMPLTGMTTHLDITETTDGLRLAVLARAGEGLLCVDITDPATPRQTDSFLVGMDFARAVAVADGIVYVADHRDGGLKALRLVSPGRFEPLYQANLFGACWSLAVAGDMLVAGYNHHGFRLFELPDLDAATATETTPILTLLSTALRNRSNVHHMLPLDDELVIANGDIGVDLYHIDNPSLPWLGDEYKFKAQRGMEAHSCAKHQDYIYVSAWEAGVLVFRISDEPAPAEFNLENVTYEAAEPEQ